MNKNLVRLIDDYLEDYEIFLADWGYEEDTYLMSPESYIKGRLLNEVEPVMRAALAELEAI